MLFSRKALAVWGQPEACIPAEDGFKLLNTHIFLPYISNIEKGKTEGIFNSTEYIYAYE